MTNLNGIAEFVATVELKSFVLAAQHTGMTASGVSKAVARLEKRLGVRLLKRSTRRLTLTASGVLFYQQCRQILLMLREVEGRVSRGPRRPRGTLTVDLAPALGRLYIMPALPNFARQYPDLVLHAVFRAQNTDHFDEGIDLAVRVGSVSGTSVTSRRIGITRYSTCASPDYLKKHGLPKQPEDLLHHNCLSFLSPATGRLKEWNFADGRTSFALSVHGNLAIGNTDGILEAAIKGVGVAQLPDFMTDTAVREGVLKPVLERWTDQERPICVVTPNNKKPSENVDAFIKFVSRVLPEVNASPFREGN